MAPSRRAVLGSIATAGGGCLSPPGPAVSASCPAQVSGTDAARIGFTGDVMLGRDVNDRWADGPSDGVWGSLHGTLTALDGLFINLECCLSDRGSPRPGRTYHFRADPDWAIPALNTAEVTWASLANNHVLDFGSAAFEDTLAALSDGGIPHAGAGMDRSTAFQPSMVKVGGLSVAVVAFTDRSPLYAAGTNRPGTAFVRIDPGDPTTQWLVRSALERARAADPDLIVASLHWGPNWETQPSTERRAFARWLIDQGVDVIHGHSAHVIQGVEVYRGRPIIYDAGEFVDDYAIKAGLHNDRSFLFELEVREGRLSALRLRPIEITNERVVEAGRETAAWLRTTMRERSAAFDTTVRREGEGLRMPLSSTCH